MSDPVADARDLLQKNISFIESVRSANNFEDFFKKVYETQTEEFDRFGGFGLVDIKQNLLFGRTASKEDILNIGRLLPTKVANPYGGPLNPFTYANREGEAGIRKTDERFFREVLDINAPLRGRGLVTEAGSLIKRNEGAPALNREGDTSQITFDRLLPKSEVDSLFETEGGLDAFLQERGTSVLPVGKTGVVSAFNLGESRQGATFRELTSKPLREQFQSIRDLSGADLDFALKEQFDADVKALSPSGFGQLYKGFIFSSVLGGFASGLAGSLGLSGLAGKAVSGALNFALGQLDSGSPNFAGGTEAFSGVKGVNTDSFLSTGKRPDSKEAFNPFGSVEDFGSVAAVDLFSTSVDQTGNEQQGSFLGNEV